MKNKYFKSISLFTSGLTSALLLCMGALVVVGAASCNKALDIQTTNQASDVTQWHTYEDARGGVFGMYGLFKAALWQNTAQYIYGDVRGGDFTITSRPDLKAIRENKLTAEYPLLQNLSDWRPFYAVVNACNLFIENSGGCLSDPRYTEQNNKVDIAAAHLLRAFAYFLLVRNWGDVPLLTSSHSGDFKLLPRVDADKVLSFVESDILAYVDDLPFSYGAGGRVAAFVDILPGSYYGWSLHELQNAVFGRVQAYIILANSAAWRGHWDDVEVYTRYVRDNYGKTGGYYFGTLAGAYSSTADMISNSPYSVFWDRGLFKSTISFNGLWGFNETGLTGEGHIESLVIAYPLISKPKPDMYVTKDSILAIYDDKKDNRFGFDSVTGRPVEAFFTAYNSSIPIFSKIFHTGDASVSNTSIFYSSATAWTRAEEAMTLRAVSLAVLEGNSSVEGTQLLNTIRSSRKESTYPSYSDLVTEIYKERRRELIGEGWRWYDLVTYKKIKRDDPYFNDLIDRGGIYWPVSQKNLAQNPLLVQTDYWK